jgi:hypothetical protein
LSWTSGLTVAAASKLSERDNNRLLNIDDIHSSAVNIPANTGNWQPGARTDFSAAQASNVWQKYNRARDLLDSLPNGLLPSANTYRTEITAKKNAVLQGFTAEASKYTDTNKSQEYDWLEAGRTFVANLSSSDRSYTLPVGYTTRDFERKLETLRREAAAYYDSVGLNYLDNLDTLTQTTKIDDLLSQLERLKNSAHKDLFDRYYAGNLPNQTTANLKSTLTAAERVLNITGVPPNATVSQRWEKILTIKKEALATAEIESARLTDAALASLRDAQTKLNEAADIYENNTVNLPDMATPTRTAATASGTAIDNFSDSTAKAALDAAEAAARATGVNIQTIQTNSNLSLSQKTAAIADLIKADAEKRQKESLEASEKTRQEAEQNRENNITTLLTAQDNLNKALIIYNELKLGDLLADTEAQQRLRSLPEATTEARDAAGAAADRESYTEKFSDNLGIALRETEEAARAAGIQTPSDYSNKSPLEKVTYNAEQLLADAQARKEAQDKTGQQRGIAEAALSRAKAALTDITQDPQDTVDAEASTAKNAAEEAQRQAERAGTKAAAENAAAAQTASAETAGLDKEIKERRNRQARIAALGDAVKTAQDGYTKISPAAASKPKQDALNAIQSAVDAQDPAEIVAVVRRGLSRRPSVWQDADDVDDVDTQTALRKILQASDQSDLEKAEALLQIIKADAAGLSNNNSGMDGFLGT